MMPPVILIIFNRPDLTVACFAAIRAARPPSLFVVADGPRPDRPEDQALCAAARAVTDRVDWPCDVVRDYSEANLGCGRRVALGISRAFERFEAAIILEDDCVPDPSFFRFCADLLERYRDDHRVMAITGNNYQNGRQRGDASYYFSKYAHIWGWATWRRAWRHFDLEARSWREFVGSSAGKTWFSSDAERAFWSECLASLRRRPGYVWSFQWQFACMQQGGLTATPNVNLVSNLGFRADATHTWHEGSPFAAMATGSLETISHPRAIEADREADAFAGEAVFNLRRFTLAARTKRRAAGLVARLRRVAGRIKRAIL